MPFKSWGTAVQFTEKRDINFSEQVPAGKQIGLYGYQPMPATLSQNNLTALQNFDLNVLVNAIQSAVQGQVNYVQLSWNELGSTQVSDMVLGVVFHNTQDVDGVQQILNTIYATSLGTILAATNMNQLNAWKAYRLNEAPENNWLMIAGIAGGVIAIAAVVYLVRRRR